MHFYSSHSNIDAHGFFYEERVLTPNSYELGAAGFALGAVGLELGAVGF